MLPVLKVYLSQYAVDNTGDIEMSKDEFKDLIVQEAVLDVMRLTTVLSQYEKNLNRTYGPLYKELTIKTLRKTTLWVIDDTQLSINKGPHPTSKELCVISLTRTGQETRKRGLLECERRFCVNHTEQLNGSAVVKSTHELVCMGLDVRLCTWTHLVRQEASLVKIAVCETYIKYGMNVFEYEHTEKQRIREETDEVSLGQTEGDSHKKDHTDPERRILTLGVSSGGTTHSVYGFSDEEEEEVS
jgi:hypothetical protein